MFQPLKNLFSKLGRKEPPAAATQTATPPPSKLTPPPKESKPAPPPPRTAPPPSAAPAPAAASGQPGEETFALPLRVVLSRLPASLAASVKSTGGGDLNLPLRKILAQLPQGAVKITFGELRQAAPPGTFLEVASQDSTMIELPLPEIVARINPNLISRRQDQKTVEVPPDVGNVFGPRGETVAPPPEAAGGAAKSAPAPAAAPKPILPTPTAAPAAPSGPKPAAPTPAAPAPAAAAPSAPSLPKPNLPKPAPAPAAPAAPIPAPKLPTSPSLPNPPPPTSPSIPKPPAPAPAAPASPIAAPKLPTPPSAPKPAAATPIAPIAATTGPIPADSTQFFLEKGATAATGTLNVPLSSVNAAWPEAIKQEITGHGLKDSNVALPMASIEGGLKSGKIVFSWREIGSWLQPTPFTTSAAGDTLLELPLKVVAPLFIAQHKPAKPQKKLNVGENIPDIFAGGVPAPAKAAAPTPAAPATPAAPMPTAPAMPSAPALPKMPTMPAPAAAPAPAVGVGKVPTTLGEVFGQSDKKDWTPREIVTKMASVKGLSGGVIVTLDGLMVAGELPAPIKADTIAAFLPQMFSRMNQYGKELQTGGDVSTMTIMFDKVPWQMSKLGKIYFAAMGRAGEPLPLPELTVICGELAQQNK